MMMDYVGGSNLNQPLLKEEAVPIDQITHYCHQLLEGLGYLHNKAVVHKDLRASSVMLDNRGKVRLTDYSVVKRLADLVCEAQAGRPGVKFETKQPVTLGRGGKKADVYRLVRFFTTLCWGFLFHPVLYLNMKSRNCQSILNICSHCLTSRITRFPQWNFCSVLQTIP